MPVPARGLPPGFTQEQYDALSGATRKNWENGSIISITPPGGPVSAGTSLKGPGDFTESANYGSQNYTPGAVDQTNFYGQLANFYQNQQAPQLQRTGIDWSGYGSAQGPAPAAYPNTQGMPTWTPPTSERDQRIQAGVAAARDAQVTYPSSSIVAPPPGSPPPPPSGGGENTGSTGQGLTAPSFGAIAGLSAPQAYSGFGSGSSTGITAAGGPSVPTGGMHPLALSGGPQTPVPPAINQSAPLQSALRPGTQAAPPLTQNPMPAGGPINSSAPSPAAGTGQPLRPGTQAFPFGQTPMPAGGPINSSAPNRNAGASQPLPPGVSAIGPGGIPAMGQYANPLFQQSQGSRGTQSGLISAYSSPDMYSTPDQGLGAQSRGTESGLLNSFSSPDMYANADQGTAAQTRGQQQGFMNLLTRDVNGGAPSLAELQLKQGMDATVNNANALAASGGPSGYAMASRQAAQTAAQTGQALAGQTAMLRAQEYAQARGELGNAINQGRAQDLQNLGMTYQNKTNQAGLQSQLATTERGQDLQNLGMTYQNKTNQAGLVAQLSTSQRAQDLTATGMSYENALAQANLEAQQNQSQAQLQASQNASNTGASMQLLGLGQATEANDLNSRMHYMDLMASKYANDRGLAQQAGQFQTQQNNLLMGAGISAGAALLPLLASDERLKTDKAPARESDVDDFLGKIRPATFRYEDERFGTGENFGLMAQDLEKSRLGKTLVVDTPIGKMVDTKKAALASIASLGLLSRRLDKLEKSSGGLYAAMAG